MLSVTRLVSAQARPQVADFVVACEKSAALIDVAERCAHVLLKTQAKTLLRSLVAAM